MVDKQPDGLSDELIIDIVAIFNNPEAEPIKCVECDGKGQLDIQTQDGFPARCDECEGYGCIRYAVNQVERCKQVRKALANSKHASVFKRESIDRNEIFKRLMKLGTPINTLIGAARSADGLSQYNVRKEWIDSLLAHAEAAKVGWDGIVELVESTNQIEDAKP